ncbi:hypothetical protein D6779_03130 [Candidatus Parcubacteria bacterium]|nr:MAG: hypothetical protein D6779_03130 [Candidatus Parcubacteria bacterium]
MRKRHPEQLLISELQLLLAEKRTYYAMLRTGVAVFALPLTVIAFLVATSDYHKIFQKPILGTSVLATLLIISLVGILLWQRSLTRIHKINGMIKEIEREDKRLAKIIL